MKSTAFLLCGEFFFFSFIEEGKFLALDLGGTNFRVLYIHLGVDHYYKVKSEVFKVPAYIQRGNGTEVIKRRYDQYHFYVFIIYV